MASFWDYLPAGTQDFVKSLGTQGAAFGTQSEMESAGLQRDPIVTVGKFVYDGLDHTARAAFRDSEAMRYGNHDQVSGKSFFEAGMLPMGTGAIVGLPMRAGETVLGAGGIRAYHASPHNFDKFDLAKIGTGEGAQAYGHGLYFADNPSVSGRGGQYDKQFSERMTAGANRTLKDHGGDVDVARRAAENEIARLKSLTNVGDQRRLNSFLETQSDRIKAFDTFKRTGEFPKANIYEVNINAKPEQFLDWDKPLSEQAHIVEALANSRSKYARAAAAHPQILAPTREIYGTDIGPMTGQDLYKNLSYAIDGRPGSIKSNKPLKSAGIPGIKYLDQGSRAAGDGSRNYVVFNPNIIEIMNKYGIALPGAAAGSQMLGANQPAPMAGM